MPPTPDPAAPAPRFRLYHDGDVYFVDPRVTVPVTFAHVADCHLPPYPREVWPAKYRHAIGWWDARFGRPHEALPRMLDKIAACGVDFVFFGGDILDYYHAETAELVVELCRQRNLPAYFIMGNHDWHNAHVRYVSHAYDTAVRTAHARQLCRHWNMPGLYYVFEHGGVRFVALNAAVIKTNGGFPGYLDDAVTDWLIAQLDYDGPIIIVSHVPFHRPTLAYRLKAIWGTGWNCLAEDDNTRRAFEVIAACPNVLGVFAAHTHMRSEDELGGTCQFIVPPGHNGQWRCVKIAAAPAPKFPRVPGVPG